MLKSYNSDKFSDMATERQSLLEKIDSSYNCNKVKIKPLVNFSNLILNNLHESINLDGGLLGNILTEEQAKI